MKDSNLKKKCVVLLSGGLDSSTVLYYVIKKNFEPVCLIFDYSQRHKKEVFAAKNIAKSVNSKYYVIKTFFPWKGSALTDYKLKIPKNKLNDKTKLDIPITYVPSRNIIFLSYAVSLAEVIGAEYIFYGANQIDYSGYPDCRKNFIQKFQQMVFVGTKSGVEGKKIKIFAPLINMSKAEIINLALNLKVPLKLTWSCYSGGKEPCGKCDSCKLRNLGFEKLGLKDPLCD
ncbi:MAG: 7-cyano-7-deazaguanine synthase QueC [Endomicrobiia bacterium]